MVNVKFCPSTAWAYQILDEPGIPSRLLGPSGLERYPDPAKTAQPDSASVNPQIASMPVTED